MGRSITATEIRAGWWGILRLPLSAYYFNPLQQPILAYMKHVQVLIASEGYHY
jgi:hypothetical protein